MKKYLFMKIDLVLPSVCVLYENLILEKTLPTPPLNSESVLYILLIPSKCKADAQGIA